MTTPKKTYDARDFVKAIRQEVPSQRRMDTFGYLLASMSVMEFNKTIAEANRIIRSKV